MKGHVNVSEREKLIMKLMGFFASFGAIRGPAG